MESNKAGEILKKLLEYLRSIPVGPVTSNEVLDSLLSKCWNEFNGSNAGGMEPCKLLGRMEEISWAPPILSFKIERHGGTVNGSTRAEIQEWDINLDTCSATWGNAGFRQLKAKQPRMNVKPLAEEIAALILEQSEDHRLKWKDDGSVQIVIAQTIPESSACKQTVQSRRKCFRTELELLLQEHGWQQQRPNVFARADN